MKNNIVVKLMQLKSAFLQSASNQMNLISDVSAISQQDVDISEQTVNTGDGKPYIISSGRQSGIKRIIIKTWSDYTASASIPADVTTYIPIGDEGVDVDRYISSLGKDLYSVLNDVKETYSVNAAIGEVCGMFQTHVSVDASSIVSYIDEVVPTQTDSVSQLKQLILSNASDGKISQYQYLTILQHVFSNGKQQVQGGSLTMNANGAYFIVNAIGTIIMSAISLISGILTSVLSAINVVLGAIAAVMVNIINVIGSLIGNSVKTDITINKDSSLNIFDAPLFAVSDEGLDDHGRVQYCESLSSEYALMYVRGSLCKYLWNNPNTNGGIMSNGFLSISVDPVRASSFLVDRFNVSVNNNTLVFSGNGDDSISNEVYLTTEETMELYTKSNDDLLLLAWYNMLFLSVVANINQYSSGSFPSNSLVWTQHIVTSTDPATKYSQMLDRDLMVILLIAAWIHAGGTLSSFVNTYSLNVTGEGLTQSAIDIMKGEQAYSSGRTVDDGMAYWYSRPVDTVYSNTNPTFNIAIRKHPSLSLCRITQLGLKFSIQDDPDCQVTEIPTDGMFSFANTTWKQVIWAITILGVVTTATIVGVAVGKIAFKKWSTRKQLTQYSKLMEKRNAYINDDGEIIGGTAEYKAFYKQMKKYNKWGRLLGYGTYDPTNNWTNAPEVAIDAAGFAGDVSIESLDSLTDNGNLSLSSITGSSSNPVSLSDIKRLITGN